jgi:ABC-type oligopeptide transport system ATPase subunit
MKSKVVSTEDETEWNGRIIEIDDAGTGDIVGDAFIGLHDTSSGEIIFRGIPVGLYNEENRNEDRPKKEILKAVKDGLKSLNFNNAEDQILLCRGNCFDLVREWFEEEEINYIPAVVEGTLQDAVEARFFSHLRKLGVHTHIDVNDYKGRFFKLFNWVARDFPNRKNFVKSGFPAWQKRWKKRAQKRYNSKIKQRSKIKSRADEILQQI